MDVVAAVLEQYHRPLQIEELTIDEPRAGEVLVIPPDLPHRVEALEESLATDLFTPRREDWITGDDAYLRG